MLIDLLESSKANGLCPMGSSILYFLFQRYRLFFTVGFCSFI